MEMRLRETPCICEKVLIALLFLKDKGSNQLYTMCLGWLRHTKVLIQDILNARGQRQGVCIGAFPAVRLGLRHSLVQAVFEVLDVLQQCNSLVSVTYCDLTLHKPATDAAAQ